MSRFTECRHVLPSGLKCRAAALRGKPFCNHHAKLHFRTAVRRTPLDLGDSDFSDLRAVAKATYKAVGALCSNYVDPKRAGLLLYGLNLAAQLQKRLSAEDLLPPPAAITADPTPADKQIDSPSSHAENQSSNPPDPAA